MTEQDNNKEQEILSMVKRVLTDVARDTHVKPGLRHPLADNTIMGIRDCLALISARESELSLASGHDQNMRPTFAGESSAPKNVVVPIDQLTRNKDLDE